MFKRFIAWCKEAWRLNSLHTEINRNVKLIALFHEMPANMDVRSGDFENDQFKIRVHRFIRTSMVVRIPLEGEWVLVYEEDEGQVSCCREGCWIERLRPLATVAYNNKLLLQKRLKHKDWERFQPVNDC